MVDNNLKESITNNSRQYSIVVMVTTELEAMFSVRCTLRQKNSLELTELSVRFGIRPKKQLSMVHGA
jgi:hypothetical protein